MLHQVDTTPSRQMLCGPLTGVIPVSVNVTSDSNIKIANANPNRRMLIVQNTGSNPIKLLASDAGTTDYFLLQSTSSSPNPYYIDYYCGDVWARVSGGAGITTTIKVTEF